GLAVGPTGDVYVCDYNNKRIQGFSSGGAYKTQWSTALGKGYGPYAISVSSTGHLFVALAKNGASVDVVEYTSTGTLVGQWVPPTGTEYLTIDAADHVFLTDSIMSRVWAYTTSGGLLGFWGSKGSGSGQFDVPVGIATFRDEVFVAEFQNDRVQRFDYS